VIVDASDRAWRLIEEMRSKGSLPALDQNVNDICSLASSSDTGTADLAAVIMRDCSLTSNLLSTANSILYRPVNPVKTVSTAVSLLGFEKVRAIAMGLSIFKNATGNGKLARLHASSYFSGSFAMSLARERKYPNPEEIFVAGLLYRLPQLAIANAYPEQYAELERLVNDNHLSYNQACLKVLKIEYDDLCKGLAKAYNLQGKVADALNNKDSNDPMVQIVHEAETIANMLFKDKRGGKEAIDKANKRIGTLLKDDSFSLADFIVDACEEDQNIKRFFNLEKDDVEMMVKVLEWGKGSPVEVASKLCFTDQLAAPPPAEDLETLIGRFFTELVMCQMKSSDINQVIMLAQEALFRCIPGSEVFMAFLDVPKKILIGRFYAGSNSTVQARDFRFNLIQETSPLLKCLANRQKGSLDVKSCPEALPPVAQRLNLTTALYAPLIAFERVIGLYFIGRANGKFEEREQAWFEQIVEMVGNSFAKMAKKP